MFPLQYAEGDFDTGCRIGGACPVGFESLSIDEHVQYFGTFPFLDNLDLEFSIFHRFDISGRDHSRDIIDFNNRVLVPSELIWVCLHPISHRSQTSPNRLLGRSVSIGPESSDETTDCEGQRMRYPGSKLGGRCHVEREQVRSEVLRLESEGYRHLLQIGLDGQCLIPDFPWDPGYLNVWAIDMLDPNSYRFCIQQ